MATRIQQRRDTAANWASANPVLADGEAGYERDTGVYKIGDGATAWNSLLPAFVPSGTVSVSVKDFRAKGDGSTDDTAAIDSARAALVAAGGGRLHFTPGKTYLVDSITVSTGVEYFGYGATVKSRSSTPVGVFIAQGRDKAAVRGFKVDANSLAQRAVYVDSSTRVLVEDIYVSNYAAATCREGIRFGPSSSECTAKNNTIVGPVDSPHGTVPIFDGIMLNSTPPDQYGGGNNSTLTFGTATAISEKHTVTGNRIYNGLHAITLYAAQNCVVNDNWCVGGSERGIILSPIACDNTVQGNHIIDAVSTGIHMAWGCLRNTITGNTVKTTTSAIEGSGIKGYYGCSDNVISDNTVMGVVEYAFGTLFGGCRNVFADNKAIGAGVGLRIMGAYTAANGASLTYTVPSSLPDAADNVATGNTFTSCTTGVIVDATQVGNTTGTVLTGNLVVGATNAYKVNENGGPTVTALTAVGNTATGTSGTVWTLIRGEQHFSRKSANTQLIDSPSAGFLNTGFYYQTCVSGTVTTINTLGNGTLRVAPFYVPNKVTVTKIGAEVTAAGNAGAVLRLGIYADDGTGYPSNLVLDAGTIAADAVAVVELTVSQVLTPGTYWVGAVPQNAATTQPTVRSLGGSSGLVTGVAVLGLTTPAAAAAPLLMWADTSATGALPATFRAKASASPTSVAARVFVKV